MEYNVWSADGTSTFWPFIRTTVVLIAGILFLRFYLTWRKYVSKVDKLPSLKLRWYHFMGHAHFAVFIRFFMKLPLSVHIYDFMLLTGYSILHQKQGLTNVWAGIIPVVNVFKAKTVEAILNHSTQLEKGWMYRFTYPWLGRGLLTSSGAKWRSRRKLLTPAFHFNILQDFLPVLNSKARVFVEVLKQHTLDEFVNIVPFGHDTTAMGMSFALYLIGLHQGHQEKIHQELDAIFGTDDRDATMEDLTEMKYLERVIKESLRLFPPVPLFGRHLTEDVEIDGYNTPKGSMCMVYAYVLHRDPEVFPNPEKFDPDRFLPENSSGRHPFAYVPFSAGPRNCIGQRFAMMEEKVVLSTLLRRFRIRSLDPRDRVHLMNEIVLRPVDGLRLEVRPRDYAPERPSLYYHNP